MSFQNYIASQFGIILPEDYVFIEHNVKVYVASKELEKLDFKRLHRKGLLAGKLESLFGIKPSLDFVLVFGHLATRNFITLPDEQIEKLYRNEKLEAPEDLRGILIVKDNKGKGTCLVSVQGNKLISLVPKERIILTQ